MIKCDKNKKTTEEQFYDKIIHKLENTLFVSLPKFVDYIIVDEQNYENVKKLISIWEDSPHPWQMWLEIFISKQNWILAFRAYSVSNGKIVTIDSHFTKISALSICENLNRKLLSQTNYCIDFDPGTGILVLNYKMLINPNDYESISEIFCTKQKMQTIIGEILTLWRKIIQIQQFLIGITDSYPQNLFEDKQTINFRKNKKKLQNIIENCLSMMNQNTDQLQNFGNNSEMFRFVMHNYSQIDFNIQAILNKFKSEQQCNYTGIQLAKVINELMNTNESSQEIDQNQQTAIVKQIRILASPQSIKWKKFAKGGFGILQKANVKYSLHLLNDIQKESQAQVWYGEIVRKSDLGSRKSKIYNEKKILQILSHQYHQNIMKFYISRQEIYSDYIFSKYEPNLSMNNFLKSNQTTISLLTIVDLLEQIIRGLIFLKYKQVLHLDIKPSNIIINKYLIAKISDFGEAIYLKNKQSIKYSGMTVPFAAYQLFHKLSEDMINQKIDIFAFGVTMHKAIFQKHIWDSNNDQQLFREKFKYKLLKKALVPQISQRIGFKFIIQELLNLILRTISEQQKQRPNSYFIFILLYLSRRYLFCVNNPVKKYHFIQ